MGNPSRFDKWSDDQDASQAPADAVQPLDLLREVAFYAERAEYYREKLWEARARLAALEDSLSPLAD